MFRRRPDITLKFTCPPLNTFSHLYVQFTVIAHRLILPRATSGELWTINIKPSYPLQAREII